MSFTLISGAMIILAITALTVNAVKGHTQGLHKSLMRLARVLIATFSAIAVSFFLSDIAVNFMFKYISRIKTYKNLVAELPSIEGIVKAYIDAAITPLFFLAVFVVAYILVNIISAIIYRIKYKKLTANVHYDAEDAPWYVRNSKPLGAIVGGLTGLFMASIIIAAIFGTLKLTVKTIDTVNSNETLSSTVKIPSQITEELRKYSNDLPTNVIYYCGGNLVYKISAASTLNGNRFAIDREIKGIDVALTDAMEVLPVLNNLASITPEQRQKVLALSYDIGKSETLKAISADFMSSASTKWLEGEEFMDMAMPKVGNVIEPIVGNILYACKSTTAETAEVDIDTLLQVYIIISENKLLESGNYEELILHFSENDVIDEICSVLEANPRMKYIAKAVKNVTMNTVASAINAFKYDIAQYDMLMVNLADSLNNMDGLTSEQKVSLMTENAMQYINDYGIEMPESIAKVTAEQLISELSNENGRVTPQRLQVLFDSYALSDNAE